MRILERTLASSRVYEWSRRAIGAESEMRHLVDDVVKPASGSRLLDFGCGNGRLVPFVPQVTYVGVDNNPSYIEDAATRHGSPDVTFVCADLNELGGIGVEPVDTVVCIGVLHHLDDDTATTALHAARHLTKTGGRLITMDPCFEPTQHSIARVLMALDRGKFVRHPAGYRALISQEFEIDQEHIWGHVYRFPYTHFVTVSTPIGS